MFQKNNKKTQYTEEEISANKLVYIPESRKKINNDLSKYQYFLNIIEPDYSVKLQFDQQSKNDTRFQTRVDLLLEREQEMRQGTFNPLLYKHHVDNNDPQNLVTKIYTPSQSTLDNQQSIISNYPKTPANPHNRPMDYMNINTPLRIQKDNNMFMQTPSYTTNFNNVFTENKQTKNLKTAAITYNNRLFTVNEKTIILNYNLAQENLDPLYVLNKEAYTIGSLLKKYLHLYTMYSKNSPLYNKINRAIKNHQFIIKKTQV